MPDHHKLGRELGLFDTDPLIGAGLPYWLPDGATVRHALEEYVRGAEHRAGFQHVYSPVLAKRELYEISGHWAHYRDDMYPPMRLGSERDAEQIVLRPSLCPHHALIYRSRARSYRELPLRLAEIGGQYRAELSGVLGGLTRVRAMQLNDAHIFCDLDQIAAEASAALDLIRAAYAALGISPVRYRLSLPGPGEKYVDDRQMWHRAEDLLASVLESCYLPYEEAAGEAAFYGPKIDVQVADAAGREVTMSTIQVDFYMPSSSTCATSGRMGPAPPGDAAPQRRRQHGARRRPPHRGPRRAFPAWLAPVQLVILPVSEAELDPAEALRQQAAPQGLRARVSRPEHGSLGARIRAAGFPTRP